MRKIIKGLRDSLGVPIEPDEERPIYYDWNGGPIYPGDEYYQTSDGKVLASEIADYLGVLLVAEYDE